ncbi:MAG: molybdenum cofactor guanylyltransferase [Bacteroidales bacterium]|nr:molybdenum cofactor guanylyltransferase [Bacteroidales bacterium]
MINNTLCGVVLAGGKSSRFGSDKALSMLNGKTFLENQILLLTKYCSEVFISGDKKEYDFLQIPKIKDLIQDKGPIGGIFSCLINSNYQYNLFIPCDMPLIDDDLVRKLVDGIEPGKVCCFSSNKEPLIPFPLIMPTCCVDVIKQNIVDELLDLKSNIESIGFKNIMIDVSDLICLKNINKKDQYIELFDDGILQG